MNKTTEALKLAEEAGWGTGESYDDCIACSRFDVEEFFALAFAAGAAHEREARAEQDHFAGGGKAITFPNLQPVINWLDNGCDPKEAAKELRIYHEQMKAAPVSAPEHKPIPFGQPGSREGFPPLEPLETLAYPLKECRHCGWLCTPNSGQSKKFYPLPQEREWVELTDDEINELIQKWHKSDDGLFDYARAFIAAFKERNK